MKSCEKHFQIFVEDVQLCLDFFMKEEESISLPSSPELYLETVVPPIIQLKDCRVCIRNLKSMTEDDLKKLGVLDFKRMLRKYEKREKHNMLSGETEMKLRNNSSESSFSSRNGSGHKSSHRSTLHNSVSWKNELIGSDFDVFTYKVNRCKVKNCKVKKCIGYHGYHDRRRDPKLILYKPSLCDNISSESSSKCPRGDSCPLSHSIFEIRYHPKVYKMYNCKEYKEGYCEKGDFCENIHKSSAEPRQAKPKKTVSRSEKVVSKISMGTVDFASSSSVHLDNSCDSKYRKGLAEEMSVMHSNITSSIDILPKPEYTQNSFKEVSSIKPKLSSSNVTNVEDSSYLKVSCKSEKSCPFCTDDLFLRCFKTLLVLKDLLSELGEWVSDLYCKVSSGEWKNVCMGEYLAIRENCNHLYKIYRLLSSDTNGKIGVDNSKIKESRILVKRVYSRVYSIRSKKLYLGLDINSLAEQTVGQTYNAIFKNVRNILTVTGKPKVENVVIDNICKKIIDKQSKLKISQRENLQNSSNEMICASKDPVEDFSKESSSGYVYKTAMFKSGKNQSVDKNKDTTVSVSGQISNTMELLGSKKIHDSSVLADDICKEISHKCISPDFQNGEWDRKISPESYSKILDETAITKESSVSKPPTGNLVNLNDSHRILSTENVSATALKLPASSELGFCNEKLTRNSDSREAIDDRTVCGVPIQNMIKKLQSITFDLPYTQIFENVENLLKYADPNVERKIVNYISREVCRENLKQQFLKQNYVDNKRDSISFGDMEVSNKKEVFQNSFEDIGDENISQTDLNIPLCFPSSKNEVTNGKEGQGSLLPNPLISEEDILRGMDWEAPEVSESRLVEMEAPEVSESRLVEMEAPEVSECSLPKRKKVFPIYVPDSSDCEIIESPNPYQKITKNDPDLVVLPNSPVIKHEKNYCSQEKVKLNGRFSSRLNEGSSKVRYHHSTSVSKRKGTIRLDNITEVKKSRPGNTFETCITIPSSPEDNFD
ncbi:uncharacterized protein [Palaemon carinicauda]